MSLVTVTNMIGTSDQTPPAPYSSWLEYWQYRKGRRASRCCAAGCYHAAEDGAHVRVRATGRQGIVPLCHECNMSQQPFNVEENDILYFR